MDLWVTGSSDAGEVYVPLDILQNALDSIGLRSSWNASQFTWAIQTPTSRADTWGFPIGTGIGAVEVDGSLVTRLNVVPGVDLTSGWNGADTVFLPLSQVSRLLADVGVQNTWDGASRVWRWVPPLQTSEPLGPPQGVQEVRSDILASGANIMLRNLQVDGDVIVAPSPNGSVSLDHVCINGKLVILAGSGVPIQLTDIASPRIDVDSEGPVSIQLNGGAVGVLDVLPGVGGLQVTGTKSSMLEVGDFTTSPVVLAGGAYEAAEIRADDGVLNVETSLPLVRVQASNATLTVGQGQTVGLLQVSPAVDGFSVDNFGTIQFLVNSSPHPVSSQGTGSVEAAMGAMTPAQASGATSGATGA
ncbi:hypothetical protein [Alicyclobacillus sendaiensis]|uniref:Copper amine oxidase-like N-terminal domain-containing protein n=1 Tax=Alicyclobacillus sendaiensis PA2 TaxID=3029425 RepID=A0ABT6XWS5_ALISE|nr:hypothetical protein [Alicyclobacillus sendaiensis]MDI9259544.1 hypothetical protein [Alicyclobacillus sendaiensis PA2]